MSNSFDFRFTHTVELEFNEKEPFRGERLKRILSKVFSGTATEYYIMIKKITDRKGNLTIEVERVEYFPEFMQEAFFEAWEAENELKVNIVFEDVNLPF